MLLSFREASSSREKVDSDGWPQCIRETCHVMEVFVNVDVRQMQAGRDISTRGL